MKQGRHRRAGPRVRLHVPVGGRDGVAFQGGVPGVVVPSGEVCHSGEEGDDEGQQGDVDAEKHGPRLDAAVRVSEEVEKAEEKVIPVDKNTNQPGLEF